MQLSSRENNLSPNLHCVQEKTCSYDHVTVVWMCSVLVGHWHWGWLSLVMEKRDWSLQSQCKDIVKIVYRYSYSGTIVKFWHVDLQSQWNHRWVVTYIHKVTVEPSLSCDTQTYSHSGTIVELWHADIQSQWNHRWVVTYRYTVGYKSLIQLLCKPIIFTSDCL
jgi:hypothetical protein